MNELLGNMERTIITSSDSGSKKRKNQEGDSFEDQPENILKRKSKILNELIASIEHTVTGLPKESRNKLSRDIKAIKECGKCIESCSDNIAEEKSIKEHIYKQNIVLNEHSRLLKEIKEQSQKTNNTVKTYASVSSSLANPSQQTKKVEVIKVAGLKKPINTDKTFKTILESNDKSKPILGEELLKIIKSNIRPSRLGFHPKKLYATRDNKVVLETEDFCLDKLKNSTELKRLNIVSRQIGKLNPRITIFNVPIEIGREVLAREILDQNNIRVEEGSVVKPLYKFGPRDKHYVHWVIEVDSNIRKILMELKTVYIGWHSCGIDDKVHLTKCYNCQGFGHIAAKCNQKKACGHCAEEHDTRQCPNKDRADAQRCILCLRTKQDETRHRPRDGKCIAFKRRMELFVASIDYGRPSQA